MAKPALGKVRRVQKCKGRTIKRYGTVRQVGRALCKRQSSSAKLPKLNALSGMPQGREIDISLLVVGI